MNPTASILLALLALPAHMTDRGEPREDRQARLEPVAVEMTEAANGNQDVLRAMTVLGKAESHFAGYVTSGRCSEGPRGQRCDDGRARGVWQLHRQTCPKAWAYPEGSRESLHEEARCAAALLRYGFRVCKSWAGAFGVYAGVGCSWSGGAARARAMGRAGL